jgi:hypothetical protein
MGNSSWKCQCGHLNEAEFTICLLCGRQKSQAAQQVERPVARESTQPIQKQVEQARVASVQKQDTEPRKLAGSSQRFGVNVAVANAGKVDWKSPLKKNAPTSAADETLSAEEVQKLVNFAVNAGEGAGNEAAETLLKKRPALASTLLVNHLLDKKSSDEESRQRAVLLLGTLGDKNAVPILLKMKKELPSLALSIVLSIALGNLGDPAAIPLLVDDQKRSGADVALKTASLVALGQIGNPTVLPRIALDCATDNFSDLQALTGKTATEHMAGKVVDVVTGVQPSVLNSALSLAGMAIRKNQLNHITTWMMPYFVNDEIPLDVLQQAPAEIRKGWMYRTRIGVIMNMCANVPSAYQELAKAIPQAQSLSQSLIIAIAASVFDPNNQGQWLKHILNIRQNGARIEKILAYDALLRLGEYAVIPEVFRGVETAILVSVASSIILHKIDPFFDQALALADSPNVDVRIALLPAIITRANSQDPRAMAAYEKLQKDDTPVIQEMIQRFRNGGYTDTEVMLFGIEVEPSQSANAPFAPENTHQAPKWSRVKN